MKMTPTQKEAFALMAEKMDKREALYKELEKFHDKYGTVPAEYAADWHTWTVIEKRIPWRQQQYAVKRLVKAAKKAVRNAEKKSS